MILEYISKNFITILGTASLVLFITSEIILGIKLAKKFDKQFPKFVNDKDALENGFGPLSKLFRGLRYAGCIFYKNASQKRKYCCYFFNGYDFRRDTTRCDWFLLIIF